MCFNFQGDPINKESGFNHSNKIKHPLTDGHTLDVREPYREPFSLVLMGDPRSAFTPVEFSENFPAGLFDVKQYQNRFLDILNYGFSGFRCDVS